MENLSKEEVADILYCLKIRKDTLLNNIRFFNEVIKDNRGKRLDILENSVLGYKTEIDKIDLITLKLQNLL